MYVLIKHQTNFEIQNKRILQNAGKISTAQKVELEIVEILSVRWLQTFLVPFWGKPKILNKVFSKIVRRTTPQPFGLRLSPQRREGVRSLRRTPQSSRIRTSPKDEEFAAVLNQPPLEFLWLAAVWFSFRLQFQQFFCQQI